MQYRRSAYNPRSNPGPDAEVAASRSGALRAAGFTLFELMIVLAIVGVMVAFAVPSFSRYAAQEYAKDEVMRVAGALREARVRAMKEGLPYLVYINPDTTTTVKIPPGYPAQGRMRTVARIVCDSDLSGGESTGDSFAMNVDVRVDPDGRVRPYAASGGIYNTISEPDVNPSAKTLSTVQGGSTFPLLTGSKPPTTVVAFGARGMPFDFVSGTVTSGTGGYYVFDGSQGVYGAILGPLGEVRVMALGAQGVWR